MGAAAMSDLTARIREVVARLTAEAAPAATAPPDPDPVELARVLALPLDRLDVVLTVRTPWWPNPLYFVPGEADAEALVAAGEATRGAIWTARELLDLVAMPGLEPAGVQTVVRAKVAFDGQLAEVRRPPTPGPPAYPGNTGNAAGPLRSDLGEELF
jgi:hypothetical protein